MVNEKVDDPIACQNVRSFRFVYLVRRLMDIKVMYRVRLSSMDVVCLSCRVGAGGLQLLQTAKSSVSFFFSLFKKPH